MSVSVWQDRSSAADVIEVDAVIVGAGISGASVAWWMKDSGLSVAVVDRGDVCAGASGRNAGFITCGSVDHFSRQADLLGQETALALWRMSQDNIDLIEELLVGDGLECDFQRRGTFSLAGSEPEMAELRKTAEVLTGLGVRVSLWDEGEICQEMSAVGFAGGVLYEDDGEVHPVKLVRGILARSGATVYPHHEVRALRHRGDGLEVLTQKATFRASMAVLATNGYSHQLHPWFAERIYPTRGQILVTEPVAPFLSAPCYANFVLDYFRQLPTGEVLIGGFRQLEKETVAGTSDEPSPVVQEALEGFLNRHFPVLKDVSIDYRWSGTMGFSVDGLPMIGSLPGQPNIYFLGGYTAHGIGWGFKAGQLMSRLILEGETPPLINARRLQ